MGSLSNVKSMERMRKLFILIICLNKYGMVQGNMFEELLLAVNRIERNLETVMHKVETMENTIKEKETNLKSIRDDVKILHNEVEINSKQLGNLKEEVRSDMEELNVNHSNMNLQYLEIVEEVKKAGSINLNMEQCVEKYSKHSNVIEEHLNSLKEEVKSVQDKNAKEINLNIEDVVKLTSNHSQIILQQIKVSKEEVSSLKEENGKNIDAIFQLLGCQKIHSDNEYDYYKVPVSNGTSLLDGAVSHTCEKVGMKAVCNGPEGCKYDNKENCVVTPLSSDCGNPMYPLSKILCDGKTPRLCNIFEGVFHYMFNWSNYECGVVDGIWCHQQKYTSGEMRKGRKRTYYGYCAKRK